MRTTSILKTLGLGAAAAVAAALAAERLVLRRVDATPSPPGWRNPTWPEGRRIMVPTDDGAELLIEDSGPQNAATIVLIHGLAGDHHSLGLVAQPLIDQGFRVVGINQRGHGGSSVGSEGFGADRQGADLGQVLRALDLRDVTLVGHSMGGLAALALMILRPETGADRVAALTLVATLAQAVGADREGSLKLGETAFYRNLAQHPVHGPVLARWIFGRTPSRQMVEDIIEVGNRCPVEHRTAAGVGMLGYDVRDRLHTIDRPTTVICGTRDVLTRHRENEAIADAIPGASFISVPDDGHMVIWESPEIIVDAAAALARANSPAANV